MYIHNPCQFQLIYTNIHRLYIHNANGVIKYNIFSINITTIIKIIIIMIMNYIKCVINWWDSTLYSFSQVVNYGEYIYIQFAHTQPPFAPTQPPLPHPTTICPTQPPFAPPKQHLLQSTTMYIYKYIKCIAIQVNCGRLEQMVVGWGQWWLCGAIVVGCGNICDKNEILCGQMWWMWVGLMRWGTKYL